MRTNEPRARATRAALPRLVCLILSVFPAGLDRPLDAAWVVNEIHADPHPDLGDAGGDGEVDLRGDEFVEIVNSGTRPGDLAGWSLADGLRVRHVFPSGTEVPAGCAIVVFGGGILLRPFGGALAQVATSGGLGLDNSGDSVRLLGPDGEAALEVVYGRGAGSDQSITRVPDVAGAAWVPHSAASGSRGALHSPGTLVTGSHFPGCPQIPESVEVWEIQGSGPVSPWAYQRATTLGNIVTAVGPRGFFLETPPARRDRNPATSDGIYVFTGAPPGIEPGDVVDVTGLVVEFFGLTELTSAPRVERTGHRDALPSPVVLDEATPSGLPDGLPDLERLEGMRVAFEGGTVTGPTDLFGELAAVARSRRAFREPGIRHPGIAGLPVWDGNPEVFEIAPRALGGSAVAAFSGDRIEHCMGPLTFHFGEYQVWPVDLRVRSKDPLRPVRRRRPGEATIATQNLFRLFDDQDDPATADAVSSSRVYRRRLGKLSRWVREVLRSPDILAVQEAEHERVLRDLAERIRTDERGVLYRPLLVEGSDPTGIDVGFLVREAFEVIDLRARAADATFEHGGARHATFPRPPLALHGLLDSSPSFPLTVIAVHLRSLRQIDEDPLVRAQRKAQASALARIVDEIQDTDPEAHLVVIGDFNAFEFSDGWVDVLGEVTGRPDPAGALLPPDHPVRRPLENLVLRAPSAERYSFIFRGSAQALDHALVSSALASRVSGVAFGRGNADAPHVFSFDPETPVRSSDHDGLVVFIRTTGEPRLLRGDADASSAVDISDAIAVIERASGRKPDLACPGAGDLDGDGDADVLDAIAILTRLFRPAVPLEPIECVPVDCAVEGGCE